MLKQVSFVKNSSKSLKMKKKTFESIEERKTLTLVGVLLLFLGLFTFIFNYERKYIDVQQISRDQEILEYYAPLWDPFPHHVKITVEASKPVKVISTVGKEFSKSEIFFLQLGDQTVDVNPGETIRINVENLESANGTIKTVLWCDSWNYAAAVLTLAGIIVLIV
jgi:hypothetical protein